MGSYDDDIERAKMLAYILFPKDSPSRYKFQPVENIHETIQVRVDEAGDLFLRIDGSDEQGILVTKREAITLRVILDAYIEANGGMK